MERDERKRLLTARSPEYIHRSGPKKKPRTCSDLADHKSIQQGSRHGVPKPVDLYGYKFIDRDSPNPPRSKNKDGHFRFVNGDNIGSRYKILSLMGEGTFGRVLECWDRHLRVIVAIKVIRSVPKYRDAAMIELEVLNTITRNDPDSRHCCIHLQHWFDYRGHVCIVFEKLGISLYDFMHRNAFRPFPLDVVQHIARQMLHAIVFLHSLNIVHTDLKPENILLKSSEYVKIDKGKSSRFGCRVPINPEVRVIDFGSATFNDDRHSTVVSTRHYRAPEVILGLGWSFECDIWSAGCIIVELITGRALFQTHENLEHLAMMEKVLDKIPGDLARRAATDARKYFTGDNCLCWYPTASRKSIKAVQQLTSLKRLLKLEADSSATSHLDSLHSLLREMLTYHPHRRRSARDCLSHDFFKENIRSLLPREDENTVGEEWQAGTVEPEVPSQQRSHVISKGSQDTGDACPRQSDKGDVIAAVQDPGEEMPSDCPHKPRDSWDAAQALSNKDSAPDMVPTMTTRRAVAQACKAALPSSANHARNGYPNITAEEDGAVLASGPEAEISTVIMASKNRGQEAQVPPVASKENGMSRRTEDRQLEAAAAKAISRDFGQNGHLLDGDGIVLVESEQSKAGSVPLNLEEDARTSDQAENVRWAHVSYAGV